MFGRINFPIHSAITFLVLKYIQYFCPAPLRYQFLNNSKVAIEYLLSFTLLFCVTASFFTLLPWSHWSHYYLLGLSYVDLPSPFSPGFNFFLSNFLSEIWNLSFGYQIVNLITSLRISSGQPFYRELHIPRFQDPISSWVEVLFFAFSIQVPLDRFTFVA